MKILTVAWWGGLHPPHPGELAPVVWVWESWSQPSIALGEPPPLGAAATGEPGPVPYHALRRVTPDVLVSGELALTLT